MELNLKMVTSKRFINTLD